MPLLKKSYTSKDYWNLPDGQRAELIDGQFYNMAPPSRIHQEISYQISRFLGNYIESNGGKCRVYPPPFAVNLDADDKDWAEPDISLICDPNKLTDRGCSGAPDLIFEIVSPSSRRMDYIIKNALTPLNLPNKIRRRPLLLFRKTIFFLAKLDGLHKKCHILCKHPHRLLAFLIHLCLPFLTAVNTVPVSAGCDRHIADGKKFVQFIKSR